jgi:hypothetical protein
MATAITQSNIVEVSVTIVNGQPTIAPDPIFVSVGQDLLFSCNTDGEMCLAFTNSGSPCAYEYAEGTAPFSLGPYAVVGSGFRNLPTMSYKYTIGWRSDDSQSWTFTDPVVIVDAPGGPGPKG